MVTTGTCILISIATFILGGNVAILGLALLSMAREKREDRSGKK